MSEHVITVDNAISALIQDYDAHRQEIETWAADSVPVEG
jgi:hypothetical protein